MNKVIVFNQVSADGYFADANGDMSWAHKRDPEWSAFTANNAKGGGVLLFGRVTYEMMASYWPSPQAAKDNPGVAEGINKLPKVVFSRTLKNASWNNTRLVHGDLAAEVRKLKQEAATDIVIMGSGTIVAQLSQERLIDEYQLIVNPLVLGSGKSMFAGVRDRVALELTGTRAFQNGNVLLNYALA